MRNDKMFIDEEFNFNIDCEDIEIIDMRSIDESASNEAEEVVRDVIDKGSDENEIKHSNKTLQKIKQHKDTLRLYFKMLRSNEETHDILVKNITMFPHNPQLYTSLSRLQDSIISIKSNIEKVIKLIDELNPVSDSIINQTQTLLNNDGSSMSRGTRDFIKEMREDEE